MNIEANKKLWDGDYNWCRGGDEWSEHFGSVSAEWQLFLYPRIRNYIKDCKSLLEIAPGFGRWTQFLKDMCRRYQGVELSESCTQFCKERFRRTNNKAKMKFYTNDGKSLDMISDNSIDFCFSFDSLVHTDKDAMESYIAQLGKKLKIGAHAFIHHSNFAQYKEAPTGWRSAEVDFLFVQDMCGKYGLHCVQQELVKWCNEFFFSDCISVIRRSDAAIKSPTRVFENPHNQVPDYGVYLAANYGLE
jgi:cyclopropane fatty-acyl-phospholipid synthase-like methyltransferase